MLSSDSESRAIESVNGSGVERTGAGNNEVNVQVQPVIDERTVSTSVKEVVGEKMAHKDKSKAESGQNEVNMKDHDDLAVAESILVKEDLTTKIGRDESLFKTSSIKRKRHKMNTKKNKKSNTCKEAEHICVYTFDEVRFEINMKNVQTEEYFPDWKTFIDSVVMLMRGEGGEQFTVLLQFKRLVTVDLCQH